MKYDIRNMSIWKNVPDRGQRASACMNDMRSVSLEELNLSVRSFNSLKRAGCSNVGDILDAMGEEGDGLRRIRNLGARSETEIKEKLDLLRVEYASRPATGRVYGIAQGYNSVRRLDNRFSQAMEVIDLTGLVPEDMDPQRLPEQEAARLRSSVASGQEAKGLRSSVASDQEAAGLRSSVASDQEAKGLRSSVASDQNPAEVGTMIILRPARVLWDREIGEFHLSHYAEDRLRHCGINKLKDLYATHPKNEPGWYAVRELFRKISEFG